MECSSLNFIRVDIYRSKSFIFIIFLSVFFALSPPGLALDPQKKITQYMHDTWRIEQGLPQNTINAVVQTSDGYLWLGTEEGLVRFDGVHFEVYDKNKVEQIASNIVLAFCLNQRGNLWIGTHGGGLIRLDAKDKKFTAYTKWLGLSNDRVRAICEDREGNLWIGTDHGLNCLKEGKFTVYTTREGLSANFIKTIYEDRQGNLWIGTYGGGLDRMNRQNFPKNHEIPVFTSFTTQNGLSNDFVKSIYEDREGSLWIGTSDGLNRLKDGKFTSFTAKEGLANDMVRCIYEDRQGRLWMGTTDGLNRLHRLDAKDESFTLYTTKQGLFDNYVLSIYEDRKGILWIGTYSGLSCMENGRFTNYTTKDGGCPTA